MARGACVWASVVSGSASSAQVSAFLSATRGVPSRTVPAVPSGEPRPQPPPPPPVHRAAERSHFSPYLYLFIFLLERPPPAPFPSPSGRVAGSQSAVDGIGVSRPCLSTPAASWSRGRAFLPGAWPGAPGTRWPPLCRRGSEVASGVTSPRRGGEQDVGDDQPLLPGERPGRPRRAGPSRASLPCWAAQPPCASGCWSLQWVCTPACAGVHGLCVRERLWEPPVPFWPSVEAQDVTVE